ncbi:MAG: carbohydrate kinase [Actinomycetota bacterium]|nr:carbohydrate kinase [Actinomycetota bacterium]
MITVVGEALVDIIVDPAGEVTSVIGGAPLNTARAAARLGIPATFLGGVSTDAFGRRIMRLLEQDGVTLAPGRQVPEPTTLAIAALDAGGAATYRFLMDGTSASALTPDVALAYVDQACRALHVGTLGLVLEPLVDASLAVVAAAREDQVVMVDPNCRPSVMAGSPVFRAALDVALARADVVKVSGDDLDFLFPGSDRLAAARDLQAGTGAAVLFTDGGSAVHVIVGGHDTVVDVPQVPVVDTVGAGDSFSGGFLAWWMHEDLGRSDLGDRRAVAEAARFGVTVAGITCQRPGADPPRANEVGWA